MGNVQFSTQEPATDVQQAGFTFNFENRPLTIPTMPYDPDTLAEGIRNFLNLFSTAEGLKALVINLHLTDIKNLMETNPQLAQVLEDACRGNPPLKYLVKWACGGYCQGREIPWPSICFGCKVGLCRECAYPMAPIMLVKKDHETNIGYLGRYQILISGNLCKTCHDLHLPAQEIIQKHISTWTMDSPWPLFMYELEEGGIGYRVEGYVEQGPEALHGGYVPRNANGALIFTDSIKNEAYVRWFRFITGESA